MLHRAIATDLLEMEVDVARRRLGDRVTAIDVVDTDVLCTIEGSNVGAVKLRLEGARYDGEPLRLFVVDDEGASVAPSGWPGTLYYGDHPVHRRPWSCTRGTFEYHTFPGHSGEPWDSVRDQIRIPDLLDHLLRKAGK